MSGHLTAQLVERYNQRVLLPQELTETDAHLASCADCRQLLGEREETGAAINFLRAGLSAEETTPLEHPSYTELAAYADQQLGEVERELVAGHLLLCADCSEVMHDLKAFLAHPITAPIAATTSYQAGTEQKRDRSFWQSFFDFWRGNREWVPLRAMGATAALLLFVSVAAIVWYASRKNRVENPIVAQVYPSPSPIFQSSPEPSIAASPSPTVQNSDANNANVTNGQQPPPNADANQFGSQGDIALKDGARVGIDNSGNITGLDSLSRSDQETVATAIRTQQVETTQALEVVNAGVETLRGGSGQGIAFPVVGPVGIVVMSDRPTFRWRQLTGASSYVVNVFDRNFMKVVSSTAQPDTDWTATNALERGQVYSWQVVATLAGKEVTSPEQPAPEAKFIVLDRAKAEELSRAKRAYRDSHVTMGTLYARAGLLDEAEQELRLAQRENPRSRLVRRLLQSVLAQRTAKR